MNPSSPISAQKWLKRIKDAASDEDHPASRVLPETATTEELTEKQRREIDEVLAIFKAGRGDLPEEVRNLTESRIVGIISYHLRKS